MTISERIELGVLVVSGFLVGILTTAFLMIRIGAIPFPITAVVAGVVNIALLKLAAQYTRSAWQYAPLIAWTFVTVLGILPIFGNGALLADWRLLALLALGLAVPAVYVSSARMNQLTRD